MVNAITIGIVTANIHHRPLTAHITIAAISKTAITAAKADIFIYMLDIFFFSFILCSMPIIYSSEIAFEALIWDNILSIISRLRRMLSASLSSCFCRSFSNCDSISIGRPLCMMSLIEDKESPNDLSVHIIRTVSYTHLCEITLEILKAAVLS